MKAATSEAPATRTTAKSDREVLGIASWAIPTWAKMLPTHSEAMTVRSTDQQKAEFCSSNFGGWGGEVSGQRLQKQRLGMDLLTDHGVKGS